MKKKLMIIILSYCYSWLPAQTPNSVGLPSPNNNFLGMIGGSTGVGLDLFSGAAQISVPICNVGSKELSIPVSLNYTGSRGIKLQEYASFAGLGWQLNAGGGISRVVRGFPDERPNGYLGTGLWGQNVASWKNNQTPLANEVSGWNGTTFGTPSADGEPDIFFIRTPFFSLQFVFDEYGVPVFSNNIGLKIITSNFYNAPNYNYLNSSFKVIDDQGNQYFFGQSSQSVEQTTTTLLGTSYTFPTTWYLDKIITFNSKDVIYFYYTSASANDALVHYQTTKTYYWNGCTSTDNTPVTNTIVQPKLISSIVTSNGEIGFSYAFDRRDLVNSARLVNIYLRSYNWPGPTTTTLQTYNFQYTYFGDPTTDLNLLRLKLDKITVAGNTPVASVPIDFKVFTYNTSVNLPSRTAPTFDFWGYHTSFTPINGSTDPMLYPQLREPVLANAKANILYAVKDISGASWQFDYDLNTYYNSTTSSNKSVGGLRVSTLSKTLSTGEVIQTTYNYNNSSGNSNGQILTPSYNNLVYNWTSASQVMSETPSNVYDLNGTFISYSSVKAIGQNGGYTISDFNNFSDFPDDINYVGGSNPNSVPNVSSSTSRSYKRGLLKSQSVHKSNGDKISEEIYTYTSLTNPVIKKSWGYHWYVAGYSACGGSESFSMDGSYRTEIDDYRITQVLHKDFDQNNQSSVIQTKATYTYAANKRLMKTITSTNSKLNTLSKTFYYPEDMDQSGNGIPMLTATDQAAISSMVTSNKTNVLIHETDNNNGAITQLHNTYEKFNLGTYNNVYLTSVASYRGTTMLTQQFMKYDLATSNLISTNETNGKASSILYGYNSSLPIAKAVNASSVSTATLTPTVTYGGYFNLGGTANFTTTIAGNIVLTLSFGSYPGSNNLTNAYYTLTGPSNASGTLCFSMTGSGCNGNTSSVTLPNMPAGNYSLSAYHSTNYPSSNPFLSYSYSILMPTFTNTNEFFYEGFEQGNSTNSGNAHTGNGYYTGNYQVNFTLPNSRSYVMQWWSLVNSVWTFNEQPYTGTLTLSGSVDDVRVFPTDALVSTFSYNPLVGITGETDPSGRTVTSEYDGFSRLNITRDNDKNILKKLCYSYSGQTIGCALFTNTVQSGNFTRNNCSSGTGTTVTYTVPAGMYFSETNQTHADQLAIDDVNANGQNYANTYGLCNSLVNIVGNNSRSTAFSVTFTNSYNSSQSYYFSIGPYQSNYNMGQIPFGTYNVTIYPYYNTSYSYSYNVNGSYQSGTGTKYWYYMSMNCSSCGNISIW